jgi:hypothetical protein
MVTNPSVVEKNETVEISIVLLEEDGGDAGIDDELGTFTTGRVSAIEFTFFSARTSPGRKGDCISFCMNCSGAPPMRANLTPNSCAMRESGRRSHITCGDDPSFTGNHRSHRGPFASTSH